MSNKTSDKNVGSIEDDVKRCNELIKVEHANWIGISNQLAISHILAEREQDKKRIQELEAKNKYLESLSKCQHGCLLNSIPKQAVIDKINEYDKKMEEDAGHPHWVVTDRIVMNVLQELLEGRNENG